MGGASDPPRVRPRGPTELRRVGRRSARGTRGRLSNQERKTMTMNDPFAGSYPLINPFNLRIERFRVAPQAPRLQKNRGTTAILNDLRRLWPDASRRHLDLPPRRLNTFQAITPSRRRRAPLTLRPALQWLLGWKIEVAALRSRVATRHNRRNDFLSAGQENDYQRQATPRSSQQLAQDAAEE